MVLPAFCLPISLLSGSPPCPSPAPLQTYRKTPSLGVSWGGKAECRETVLCPLAWALPTGRECGGDAKNSTCRECGTGWDEGGRRCLLPALLWDPLGVASRGGCPARYSAHPSPAGGHHSCQAAYCKAPSSASVSWLCSSSSSLCVSSPSSSPSSRACASPWGVPASEAVSS